MIRLFPFACTSSPGEAALTIAAATIRWTNAGRRLTVRCAASTRTMLVRRRRRDETVGVIARSPRLLGPYRICTACKGAHGAIPAIANSPATPNAWPPRAVLLPIAGSTPSTCSRTSGAATIGLDTETFPPSALHLHFADPLRDHRHRPHLQRYPHHLRQSCLRVSYLRQSYLLHRLPLTDVTPACDK